ncbi:MAG TPA: acyl-CoA dehydrogenase family protein [Streptosporangiaceae bacterium]|nr:acyl-CoA dehydrogenase family protein [Streptosporangiaceae bacterium]
MIDGEELALLRQSLRKTIASHNAAGLDTALEELGWPEALAADARAAVSVLFELQGAANVTSSALDWVLAHALGYGGAAVVLPAPGGWTAPAALDGGRLHVRGVATASLDACEAALIVARAGESHVAVEVEVAALTRRAVTGADPALGLAEVVGEAGAWQELGPADWRAAVALGQLAVGHELVGASRRMLELAREHALARVQFGRPIAVFQAVRHRLAETLVAIESAAALLDAAWLDHDPQTAGMAKATAGRAARVTARHGQQVLAGIGFTTEHPFHRYLRRVLVLEQLLGGTHSLTRELGREILARGQLPALLPL